MDYKSQKYSSLVNSPKYYVTNLELVSDFEDVIVFCVHACYYLYESKCLKLNFTAQMHQLKPQLFNEK